MYLGQQWGREMCFKCTSGTSSLHMELNQRNSGEGRWGLKNTNNMVYIWTTILIGPFDRGANALPSELWWLGIFKQFILRFNIIFDCNFILFCNGLTLHAKRDSLHKQVHVRYLGLCLRVLSDHFIETLTSKPWTRNAQLEATTSKATKNCIFIKIACIF